MTIERDALAARWAQDMAVLAKSDDAAFDDIFARHSEPQRRYHGLSHLTHLFALLDQYAPPLAQPLIAHFAVWWHDAVYDPKASDNEAQSALLARLRLETLGADAALTDSVDTLIRATRSHWSAPPLGEGDYFLDADIAILGAPPETYDRYTAQIRDEYAFAPELMFRAGRTKFVAGALLHKRLFRTDAFADAFEAQARANLKRELLRLGG